jgi:hypothetical protein
MGQYDYKVERQRQKLAAEEWANEVKSIHAHSLSSMWYDDRPQDTAEGKSVIDKEFNSGKVERTLDNGQVYIFTKYELKGDDLIQAYSQNN